MTGRDGRRGKDCSGGIPWRACNSERAQNGTPQWVEVDSIPHKPDRSYAATPQEIAQVVVFIASPKASYITGVTVPMDSGLNPVVL